MGNLTASRCFYSSRRLRLLTSAMVPTLAALVTLMTSLTSAHAQVWVDANRLDKLPDWADPHYVHTDPPAARRVWVAPVYRVIRERCSCPPVYRPVWRRVWREPVVQTVYERVWAPARYEWRESISWEAGVKVIRREYVCVESPHWESRERQTIVSPGHWEEISEQVLVEGGGWEMVERQELVSEGYWKTE